MLGLENYTILKTLGSGSFGKVELAEHSITKAKVAIKLISKSSTKDPLTEVKVKREIKILKKFNHPNIIRLYEVSENTKYTILVMEYVSEGEFYSLIERRGRFSEEEARNYFRQIVSAVDYCHSHRITHRDIKPENLLVDKGNALKLCDFGLSNFLRDGEFLKTSCGSPNYASPEVISGEKYCGPQVDVWSMGVVLYAILAGSLPFDESNITNLFSKIKSGRFSIPYNFSDEVSDLLQRMLNPNPILRITCSQIINHPWFTKYSTLPPCIYVSSRNLDHHIIGKCLEHPQFASYSHRQATELVKSSVQNQIAVTYNILLDIERKKGAIKDSRCVAYKNVKRVKKENNNCKEHGKMPNNWVFGFRCNLKARSLMERLFEALKDAGLEWKIIDNFFIRTRNASDIEQNDRTINTIIKFDVKIYKYEECYVLDFIRKSGELFTVLEVIGKIYMALSCE
ncbi:hypothetical protein SteCoe_14860 [Stentor coeruleus]|uniref:non-specific serine/threonine protein kinase n=1 Tax=Stentor coeruleus TaxID=5963 RepID=A0A1R2C538_9CILI|nr:hypothetical protein SteCoe_14860 [Stentor coeruleus]